MALEKYKTCPACGEHNLPSLLECRKCEADLTGIAVADSLTDGKQTMTSDAAVMLFRVCECGERNPSQARKCQACGEDITDIIPAAIENNCKAFCYQLKPIDGDESVTIDKPVIIVGRESELKGLLSHKAYVSRQHARLTIVAGKVFIENLSKTNKTFINNELIAGNKPTELQNGDEIGLGGNAVCGRRQDNAAYLTFRVKP